MTPLSALFIGLAAIGALVVLLILVAAFLITLACIVGARRERAFQRRLDEIANAPIDGATASAESDKPQ